MADRGAARIGPAWVWGVGLLIVALGIAALVRWVDRRDELAASVGAAEAAERWAAERPAAVTAPVPMERVEAIEEVERIGTPVALEAVLPLGPADTGVLVLFTGEVVDGGGTGGIWIRTAAGDVVFIRILDAGGVALAAGERVGGRAVVRHDPQRVRAAREAGLGSAERSAAVDEYYLETTVDRLDR